MQQLKHAIEIGGLRAGDQLPAIRKLAEDLVMNPNTVARAYRELEHEGVIELRHGLGAFVADSIVARTKRGEPRAPLMPNQLASCRPGNAAAHRVRLVICDLARREIAGIARLLVPLDRSGNRFFKVPDRFPAE